MKEIKLEDKKYMIQSRMENIAREAYNTQLNLIMYEAYGEVQEVVEATKENLRKQKLAYEAMEKELSKVLEKGEEDENI